MTAEKDAKVKLWTRQHEKALAELEETGVYQAKKRYVRNRMGDHADVYLDVYRWFRRQSEGLIDQPEKAEVPIWLATSPEQTPPIREGIDSVIFELEVPQEDVIIMDTVKWDHIVNYWYIPKDKADAKKHQEQLDKYNIKSESSIYREDFYPQLKQKIIDSWDRLFDSSIQLSDETQAALWQIKEEWVTKVFKDPEKWDNYEG